MTVTPRGLSEPISPLKLFAHVAMCRSVGVAFPSSTTPTYTGFLFTTSLLPDCLLSLQGGVLGCLAGMSAMWKGGKALSRISTLLPGNAAGSS